jgi:ABC-type sugar transport system ATPase subunit
MPLFVARNVSNSFGAVRALVDADFEVDRGEVVAVVGDNGAGKSTLIKAIAGVQPADEARHWFAGREVSIRSPMDATRLGIATVCQDLGTCPLRGPGAPASRGPRVRCARSRRRYADRARVTSWDSRGELRS